MELGVHASAWKWAARSCLRLHLSPPWCTSCIPFVWEGVALPQKRFAHVIVGGGLAAASAAEGIRELNPSDPVLILGQENHLPYDRPPLSKKLWFGKKKVADIFLHDAEFYTGKGIDVRPGTQVIAIDPQRREVRDTNGSSYKFEKLLLATGGNPRLLSIPGGTLEEICYYRTLDDYSRLRGEVGEGKSAVVIGGGFIGSEIAAALCSNQVSVTMIFPDSYLVQRVFPEGLGRAMQEQFANRGIQILSGDTPMSFEKRGGRFVTRTRAGKSIESDFVIVGVGIQPSTALASAAGLTVDNGILVNEFLQTTHPDIFAAGDNANFPYSALNQRMRVEHWDNALNQGKQAGRNMAGANESYDYMPYFFSDLFEFGYEAVGEVDSRLETFADWQKENDTGVIYYHRNGIIRGAMMCNVWGKVDWARSLIRAGEKIPRPSQVA